MFILNASPYSIFRDHFHYLIFMAIPHSSRSKDDLQPRKYLFFSYVVFVIHTFYIPFDLCESEYYEGEFVIYIFLTPETSNDLNNTQFPLINHPPYYDQEEFIQHHCNNSGKFSVSSVNIQSLRAKYNEFTILLKHLQNQGCDFSVICIKETWLPDKYDTIDLLLDGVILVTQGTKCSSHAELAIYVKNNISVFPFYQCMTVRMFGKAYLLS